MPTLARADGDDLVVDPPLAVRARLLGELEIRVGDRVVPVESARARSLLGYLLLHHGAAPAREHVAFLLWPDSTEAQARTNLRKLVHTLRHEVPALAERLEVTPRTLRWRGDLPTWIDVAELLSAMTRADGARASAAAQVDALRRAVDLYRGDLLEGCFDEWLVEERERLRDRHASALRRLSKLLVDRGEHDEAIRVGRQLLRCDPLDEHGYRLVMSAHEAAGDRAAAVRTYHECVATLQRELGVTPSPATRAVYAELTRSAPSADEPDQDAARRGGAALVGREEEWSRLRDLWCEAERGRAQLVVLTGEPGIGKTRLAEDLAAWCAHRGAAVAQARAYASEGELGYGSVIAWLRTPAFASQLRTASPADAAALARLLPELEADGDGGAEAADAAEQRRRLFDAAARVLAAPGRPTLLVLDDAQWCDSQTLALVHYVLRLEPPRPALVVATARREELDGRHPLHAVLAALHAIDRVTEIELDRLTRADTVALVRSMTDGSRTNDLFAETEGIPLFIVETVRAEQEGAEGTSGLAPKLQAVVRGRLARCSEGATEVVGMAATAGRGFGADLIRAASGMDDVELVRALDELWRRGIIREHAADLYDFAHGRIRDVAYDSLSPAARRRNHVLLAQALQRLHASTLDGVSGQVAHHYDRAGQVDAALAWYQRAAGEAQRVHADAEAVRLLERARGLVAELPAEVRPHRELEVLSAMPTALIAVEGFASDRVAEVQRRASDLAAALDLDLDPVVMRSLVMSRLCRKDFEGALPVADSLHALAERVGDEGLLVESEYLLGITAFWCGQLETARSRFERVVTGFRRELRGEHLRRFGHDPAIVCLSRLGNTLWLLGHPDDARRARDAAVAGADELGHPFTRGTAYVFAGILSAELGDHDHVRACAEAMGREEHQALTTRIVERALAGYVEALDGRPDEGIARIRTAIELAGPVDRAPGSRAGLMRLLLAAHEAVGEPEAGMQAAEEAIALDGTRIWEPEARRVRAAFMAVLGGDGDAVEAELSRATEVARRMGAVGLERRIELTRSRLGVAD